MGRTTLEALNPRVPRGAHGVRVGDQLIEAQIGDIDDLAEGETSLAGRGMLDAAPTGFQQVLAIHHVIHADHQRTAKLLAVRAGQGAQLLGLLVRQITDRQVRRIGQGLLVTLAIEDQRHDIRVRRDEFFGLLLRCRQHDVLEGRTQVGH